MVSVLLLLGASMPALAASPERRVQKLVKEGAWLTARELADEALREDPGNAKLRRALEELEASVRRDAENLEFDPRRYFYAMAYLDYFQGRHGDAVDDLEQVLTFELENEEALAFMDKASARVAGEVAGLLARLPKLHAAGEREKAREAALRALALSPGNAEAKAWLAKLEPEPEPARPPDPPEEVSAADAPVAAEPAARPARPSAKAAAPPKPAAQRLPADPDWVEARYREALKSYVKRDLGKSLALLREILDRDPANERCRRALQRIEKER